MGLSQRMCSYSLNTAPKVCMYYYGDCREKKILQLGQNRVDREKWEACREKLRVEEI